MSKNIVFKFCIKLFQKHTLLCAAYVHEALSHAVNNIPILF